MVEYLGYTKYRLKYLNCIGERARNVPGVLRKGQCYEGLKKTGKWGEQYRRSYGKPQMEQRRRKKCRERMAQICRMRISLAINS